MNLEKYQQEKVMIIPQDYSRGNYKLIAVGLSKEKSIDADQAANQQTVFQVLG